MARDSDYEDEDDGARESDDEYVGDDGSEQEDDDDSDFGGRKRANKRAAAPARNTRARTRSAVSYKEMSSDEEEADDDDDDDDDDSDGGYARKRKRAAPARGGRQTRASGRATKRSKKSSESEEDYDSGDEDDEELARQLEREINGMRARPAKRSSSGPPSPPSVPTTRRAAARPSRQPSMDSNAGGNGRRSRSQRSATQNVSYAEDGGSDEFEDSDAPKGKSGGGGGGAGGGKRAAEPIAAFDGPGDDEVERVLGHRDIPGADVDPNDPWASKQFLIKWMRHSFTHCSWDTRATLEQLGGFKRVLNYMKKVDHEAAEIMRGVYTREELELKDLEKAMEEQLVQQHSTIERVSADGENEDGELQYLVKWDGLPYSECTWEAEDQVKQAAGGQDQLAAYAARIQRYQTVPHRAVEGARKQFKLSSTRALERQPSFLAPELTLRDYQLDGLNWMVYSWSQNRNVILADEMGLGKTVQCVSFLGYLSEVQQIRGPFLVVVPLSTVPNWIREFKRWTPQVNTIVYVGDSRSREVLRSFEFDPQEGKTAGRKQFECLITTYELILKDANILGKIKWNYLCVDEAHRLKNAESALYQELSGWHFANKLLVTGTPLQNCLRELWALLHFLEPSKFPDVDEFETNYQLEHMEGVQGLHAALRPHLLRRVIKEVEKSLPPKNERILRIEMTPLQKQYYKWILSRNFRELNKGLKGGQVSLLNIIIELKKVCNHPFLFESAEESFRGREGDRSVVDRLVVASGKMVLLDKLLRRLKATGHRVLIFSQMVRVLDIISDYLRLRGWQHQRLDGSTPSAARHTAMEHFNAPDSSDFCFLLSTRAGGLGINLATADTVIIFDSDWNPQNDLQAMSRAHRIGQKDTVNIYRFVTSGSVEEDILERAKRKMVLDHLVIQRMDTSGRTVLDPSAAKNSGKTLFGKDELAAILRFGAEDLFKTGNACGNADTGNPAAASGNPADQAAHDEEVKAMVEEDIDAILARAEVVDNQAPTEQAAPGPGGDLLSSFNVATFKNEEDDAAFWSRLIPVAERAAEEDQEELLGPRAARLKAEDAMAMDADDRSRRLSEKLGPASGGVRRGPEPGPPVEGAALRIEEWRLDVDDEGIPLALDGASRQAADGNAPGGAASAEPQYRSMSRKDAAAFVRAVKRYGLQSRIDDIASDVGKGLDDLTKPQRLALWLVLMEGCRRCVALTEEGKEDAKDAILDFFGVAVRAQELLGLCSQMRLLARKVSALASATAGGFGPGMHHHQHNNNQQQPNGAEPAAITLDVALRFKLDIGSMVLMPTPKWGKPINWSPQDDAMLLLGAMKYGIGHWDMMASDPILCLRDKLACVVNPPPAVAKTEQASQNGGDGEEGGADANGGAPEKESKTMLPKASHMETRVLGLLRKLHQVSKAPPPKGERGKGGSRAAGGAERKAAGGGSAVGKAPPLRIPKPPRVPMDVEFPDLDAGPSTTRANEGRRLRERSDRVSIDGGSGGDAGEDEGAKKKPKSATNITKRKVPMPRPTPPPTIMEDAMFTALPPPPPPPVMPPPDLTGGLKSPLAPVPHALKKVKTEGSHGHTGAKGAGISSKPAAPSAKQKPHAAGGKDRERAGVAGKDKQLQGGSTQRAVAPVGDKKVSPSQPHHHDKNHAHAHSKDHSEMQAQLEPVLHQIKAWRRLGEDASLDNKEVVRRMLEYIKAIGSHIDKVVTSQAVAGGTDALRARLWKQISKATKNDRDGEQLQQLYQKIAAKAQA